MPSLPSILAAAMAAAHAVAKAAALQMLRERWRGTPARGSSTWSDLIAVTPFRNMH